MNRMVAWTPWRLVTIRRREFAWRVSLEREWRDVWVGVYWDKERRTMATVFHVYLCLVPCLPIHVQVLRNRWRT